jgi:hypothetical protein
MFPRDVEVETKTFDISSLSVAPPLRFVVTHSKHTSLSDLLRTHVKVRTRTGTAPVRAPRQLRRAPINRGGCAARVILFRLIADRVA